MKYCLNEEAYANSDESYFLEKVFSENAPFLNSGNGIFPFDFSAIPIADLAGVLPVIVGIVLIGIVVGLGIVTLVSFIKLIINVFMRGTSC